MFREISSFIENLIKICSGIHYVVRHTVLVFFYETLGIFLASISLTTAFRVNAQGPLVLSSRNISLKFLSLSQNG